MKNKTETDLITYSYYLSILSNKLLYEKYLHSTLMGYEWCKNVAKNEIIYRIKK
jgi:hypothetical protein